MPTSGLFSRNLKKTFPIAVRGEGGWIVDGNGRRFLDAAGQAAVVELSREHARRDERERQRGAARAVRAADSRVGTHCSVFLLPLPVQQDFSGVRAGVRGRPGNFCARASDGNGGGVYFRAGGWSNARRSGSAGRVRGAHRGNVPPEWHLADRGRSHDRDGPYRKTVRDATLGSRAGHYSDRKGSGQRICATWGGSRFGTRRGRYWRGIRRVHA